MSREPHGFVVIPRGPDGAPTGGVLWEPTSEDAMRVYFEALETGGAYLPVLLYRPIEVDEDAADLQAAQAAMSSGERRARHAEVLEEVAEREAPCPPKSSSAT